MMPAGVVELKCADLVAHELEKELEMLRKLWKLHCEDSDAYDDEYGNLYEYGLAFGYIAPRTFSDQDEGYFRYQISCGGPSDEFQIFAGGSPGGWVIHRIEYWYKDGFDGASITLRGEDFEFMKELVGSFFGGCGTLTTAYEESMEVQHVLLKYATCMGGVYRMTNANLRKYLNGLATGSDPILEDYAKVIGLHVELSDLSAEGAGDLLEFLNRTDSRQG